MKSAHRRHVRHGTSVMIWPRRVTLFFWWPDSSEFIRSNDWRPFPGHARDEIHCGTGRPHHSSTAPRSDRAQSATLPRSVTRIECFDRATSPGSTIGRTREVIAEFATAVPFCRGPEIHGSAQVRKQLCGYVTSVSPRPTVTNWSLGSHEQNMHRSTGTTHPEVRGQIRHSRMRLSCLLLPVPGGRSMRRSAGRSSLVSTPPASRYSWSRRIRLVAYGARLECVLG
jgi:hypothetical protein